MNLHTMRIDLQRQLKINLNNTKRKYLLKMFQILVNGHTIEFHPQTQKLAVFYIHVVPCDSSAEAGSEIAPSWSPVRLKI